jgi:hypothetical protein
LSSPVAETIKSAFVNFLSPNPNNWDHYRHGYRSTSSTRPDPMSMLRRSSKLSRHCRSA